MSTYISTSGTWRQYSQPELSEDTDKQMQSSFDISVYQSDFFLLNYIKKYIKKSNLIFFLIFESYINVVFTPQEDDKY